MQPLDPWSTPASSLFGAPARLELHGARALAAGGILTGVGSILIGVLGAAVVLVLDSLFLFSGVSWPGVLLAALVGLFGVGSGAWMILGARVVAGLEVTPATLRLRLPGDRDAWTIPRHDALTIEVGPSQAPLPSFARVLPGLSPPNVSLLFTHPLRVPRLIGGVAWRPVLLAPWRPADGMHLRVIDLTGAATVLTAHGWPVGQITPQQRADRALDDRAAVPPWPVAVAAVLGLVFMLVRALSG